MWIPFPLRCKFCLKIPLEQQFLYWINIFLFGILHWRWINPNNTLNGSEGRNLLLGKWVLGKSMRIKTWGFDLVGKICNKADHLNCKCYGYNKQRVGLRILTWVPEKMNIENYASTTMATQHSVNCARRTKNPWVTCFSCVCWALACLMWYRVSPFMKIMACIVAFNFELYILLTHHYPLLSDLHVSSLLCAKSIH